MKRINAQACQLPTVSLLRSYRDQGDYVDCFVTSIHAAVTLEQFVYAFYTTPLFKLERQILKSLVAKTSTDAEVQQLAAGSIDNFAAWKVEQRGVNQLLMCDFKGNTRSWFMVDAPIDTAETTLYFGSAVVARTDPGNGQRKMSNRFNALLGLHKMYSKALLNAACRRLAKNN